jgi:DNA-binding LytR/AlgR family response regulator
MPTALIAQVHRSTVVNITQVLSAQRDLSGNMQLRIKGSERPIAVARAYQGLFKQM